MGEAAQIGRRTPFYRSAPKREVTEVTNPPIRRVCAPHRVVDRGSILYFSYGIDPDGNNSSAEVVVVQYDRRVKKLLTEICGDLGYGPARGNAKARS